MTNNPLISVVMATFNEPVEYITQSIQSILNQRLGDFELLLIDDSTNPDTIAAIDTLAQSDTRIKLIRSPQRIGFVPALNMGLRQARGKYIARMDGDDISMSNRFELQIAFLENHTDIMVVGGSVDIINEEGEKTAHRNFAVTPCKIKLFSMIRSPLYHPSIMIRKEIVNKGFYYNETFTKAEDLELWLRLIKNGYKISNIADTILSVRVIGNLADKRTKEHFKFTYKARKKNFSWRSPFWSIISLCIAKSYNILPRAIIKAVYKAENKNTSSY
jgi:glycosyltransferase involved in cell wall biosynthesis